MRRTLYPAALLVAMLLLALPVQAGEDSGEETLMWLEHLAVEIDNTGNDQLRISYDVEVTDGVNVNIYFMDEEAYDDFKAYQNFSYYQSYSIKDTDGASKEWRWTREGTFHVVIENAGWQSMDLTTFEYEVKWDEAGSLWWGLPVLWCLVILLVVGVIGIATLWLIMQALRARREQTAEGARGEGGSTGPPPGEGGVGGPSPTEMPETSPDVRVYDTVPTEGTDTAPIPSTVPSSGEGTTQLGPQPEPPDSPTGAPSDSGYRGTPEPPAPGTTVYPSGPAPSGDSVTQLSPQPEPPDMPAHATVSPTGEGATQLSPQPEPPDSATGSPSGTVEAGRYDPDHLNPDATTYSPPPTTPTVSPPTEPTVPDPTITADTDPVDPLVSKRPGPPPPE